LIKGILKVLNLKSTAERLALSAESHAAVVGEIDESLRDIPKLRAALKVFSCLPPGTHGRKQNRGEQ